MAHSAIRPRPAIDEVHLSSFDTPLGRMSLASTAHGVVACSLPGESGRSDHVRAFLRRRLPRATT
jgi:hypothetical protein